jgi:hypothetical protein
MIADMEVTPLCLARGKQNVSQAFDHLPDRAQAHDHGVLARVGDGSELAVTCLDFRPSVHVDRFGRERIIMRMGLRLS